ncbi:MAG: tRNA1(Val) (adenine(37)-N6)-methyltransferase [Deferrisomatales bacterium]
MRVIQPRDGYRFAVDSVLLARFAAEWPAARVLDLGSGCGVVALCLGALGGADEVLGLELQIDMVDRARRSARWNGAADRITFSCGDLRDCSSLGEAGAFGMVVCNPPYRALGTGRLSPNPAAAVARHEVACTLEDVVRAADWALEVGGSLCLVYPAARVARLMACGRAAGLEPKALRFVHPRPGGLASLVLARHVKGAREGLEVRPPLTLHGPVTRYSSEAESHLGAP